MAGLLELAPIRERRLPLSVEAYHILGELGHIPEKTELIEGDVVEKMPKSPLHNHLVRVLARMLRAFLGSGWEVMEEKPLHLGEFSEPEPDVAVVKGGEAEFIDRNPTHASLVIEVACSTVPADRSKAAIYAAGGVPEYWIVLGDEQRIDVYSDLRNGEYHHQRAVGKGDLLKSMSLPGFVLDWDRLYPPR